MIRANSRIRSNLSRDSVEFLEWAVGSIERILPHVEVSAWDETEWREPQSVWDSSKLTGIRMTIGIATHKVPKFRSLSALVQRRAVPAAGKTHRRALDTHEFDLCKRIAFGISSMMQIEVEARSMRVVREAFDEMMISDHIKSHHKLELDVNEVMDGMHKLSQETYENKAISFGCILDTNSSAPGQGGVFPRVLLRSKKHKALSDGFRTAYHISTEGAVEGFVDLNGFEKKSLSGNHYYPEWAEDIAKASRNGKCGICLSRQGDILVFDLGTLRFTYRYGRWQYWNHRHLVTLLKERAKAQRVPKAVLGKVVATIYRTTLDVAFRRCGGLFVMLRNRKFLPDIVRGGDALSDVGRDDADHQLDESLSGRTIQSIPRSVLVDLASLDGSVVIDNTGLILAYGAILAPKKRGKLRGTEGSRTKAAIGASNYGLSVKISSDGDITVYHQGKEFIGI